MSNLKTLTSFAFATFLANPVFAQDSQLDTVTDPLLDVFVADFVTSDLDQDGQLNNDEFITFAVMRSDDGEERFKDIVIGGEYTLAFKTFDTDASGGVEIGELNLRREIEPKNEDSPGGNSTDPNYPH